MAKGAEGRESADFSKDMGENGTPMGVKIMNEPTDRDATNWS